MITEKNYRITVLTDRLIRLEYSKNGVFEDRKSFAVTGRDFENVEAGQNYVDGNTTQRTVKEKLPGRFYIDDSGAIVREAKDRLEVETSGLLLHYDKKPFSSTGLSIEIKSTGKKWNYGDSYGDWSNLGGTARTLDDVDGRIALEKGIFGKNGYAVLDDSRTPVFDGEELVQRADDGAVDIYFFGYGTDFYAGLADFTKLCGKMPMVPRYALGNWWSRYYKYTEKSYMEVVDSFAKEGIPLSVAVIDMDWHVTEVDPKYGSGWTGYTWNKEFFPDYKRFLKRLHESGLSVTLNLHPADGIRPFEAMYEETAKEMGIDPASEVPVEFDFGDKKFRDAYFKTVMHPYEEDGVNFWWIDWQQGTGKKSGDVDPLLLLNHYHYEDQEKRNLRPMIFSRYAGVGSHRYPVGFSGDSHATWKSLNFQPYFTSTASNVGYNMWSHDIGGHMLGDKDLERLVRWIQYGVFSPVMRIHSSSSAFFNKEPWKLPEPYRSVVKKFMVFRHRMIPYLYTEGRRAYEEARPLVRPMYYDYSENPESYSVCNQYRFGESLLVCAVTQPEDRELKMAATRGLLPQGRWYDIFSGYIYDDGAREPAHGDASCSELIHRSGSCGSPRKFYRELSQMPVLLSAGGIVPLAEEADVCCEGTCRIPAAGKLNDTGNPSALCILVGAGADGEYTLYEDDGVSMDFEKGAFATTKFATTYDADSRKVTFTIAAAQGDTSLIPLKRSYRVKFLGVKAENVTAKAGNGAEAVTLVKSVSFGGTATVAELETCSVDTEITVELTGAELLQNDYRKLIFELLDRAWMNTETKDVIYDKLMHTERSEFARWIRCADIEERLKDAIEEVF